MKPFHYLSLCQLCLFISLFSGILISGEEGLADHQDGDPPKANQCLDLEFCFVVLSQEAIAPESSYILYPGLTPWTTSQLH